MMLDRIEDEIQSVPDIPFYQFYINYMLAVQDSNIQMEISSTFRRIRPDVKDIRDINRLIDSTYSRMVKG